MVFINHNKKQSKYKILGVLVRTSSLVITLPIYMAVGDKSFYMAVVDFGNSLPNELQSLSSLSGL